MDAQLGRHYTAERQRMVDYLLVATPRLPTSVIEAKLRAAFRGVEEEVETVDEATLTVSHNGSGR